MNREEVLMRAAKIELVVHLWDEDHELFESGTVNDFFKFLKELIDKHVKK